MYFFFVEVNCETPSIANGQLNCTSSELTQNDVCVPICDEGYRPNFPSATCVVSRSVGTMDHELTCDGMICLIVKALVCENISSCPFLRETTSSNICNGPLPFLIKHKQNYFVNMKTSCFKRLLIN